MEEVDGTTIVNGCICASLDYEAEKRVTAHKNWMRLYDEVFAPLHPDTTPSELEAQREAKYMEIRMLKIISKELPANVMTFDERLATTKELALRGVITRTRNKWVINRRLDPRLTSP